jgi:hypothetical protein
VTDRTEWFARQLIKRARAGGEAPEGESEAARQARLARAEEAGNELLEEVASGLLAGSALDVFVAEALLAFAKEGKPLQHSLYGEDWSPRRSGRPTEHPPLQLAAVYLILTLYGHHEDLAAKKWISENIKADPKTVRAALASVPLVQSLDLIDLLHLAGDYRAIAGTVTTVEAAYEALYGKMDKG